MKQIQPINIWINGEIKVGVNFSVTCVNDNYENSATNYWQILDADLQQISQGNLTIDGQDYIDWGNATSNGVGAGGAGSTTGCIGDIVYAGGSGTSGSTSPAYAGAGGGGAGSTGAGGSASTNTGGTGTSLNGGNGANGRTDPGVGSNGSTYGGGGSGAAAVFIPSHIGGDGGAGYIFLTWQPFQSNFFSLF